MEVGGGGAARRTPKSVRTAMIWQGVRLLALEHKRGWAKHAAWKKENGRPQGRQTTSAEPGVAEERPTTIKRDVAGSIPGSDWNEEKMES